MDFGSALTALKAGGRVTRTGWNGKGMFVAYQPGYPDGIAINANTAAATGLPQGTVCSFRPYLMMKTVDDEFVPWVASQTDILAEDWAEEIGLPMAKLCAGCRQLWPAECVCPDEDEDTEDTPGPDAT